MPLKNFANLALGLCIFGSVSTYSVLSATKASSQPSKKISFASDRLQGLASKTGLPLDVYVEPVGSFAQTENEETHLRVTILSSETYRQPIGLAWILPPVFKSNREICERSLMS